MIWQNTKVRIAIIASLVLLAIIAYRIYGNIQANNERANRVSQGQNIAVATSFPQRQSIMDLSRKVQSTNSKYFKLSSYNIC